MCGDGIPEGDEECDDGNTEDDDGCTAACDLERAVVQIVVRNGVSCALLDGGVVKCWGANGKGQLGLEDTDSRGDEPGEMGAALPYVDLDIEVTTLHSGSALCGSSPAGSFKCWGQNSAGQLGLGDPNHRGDEPGEMGAALPYVDLGGEVDFLAGGCAHVGGTGVKCWGYNYRGHLGLGDTEDRGDEPGEMGDALPYVDLAGWEPVSLTDGGASVCALDLLGSIKCWGSNEHGQLGIEGAGDLGDEPGEIGAALPFVSVGTGAVVEQVAVNGQNSCVVLESGVLKCWGNNISGHILPWTNEGWWGYNPGQMGDNLPAIEVEQGRMVTRVALGSNICAVLDDRTVKCWGWFSAMMGQELIVDWPDQWASLADMPVIDLGTGETVAQLEAGGSHACALLDSGQVKCWGSNSVGQLGLGDTEDRGDDPGEMGDALPAVELY